MPAISGNIAAVLLHHRPRQPVEKLSDVLADLAAADGGSVTLADLITAAGERSFGALLVLCGIPNMIAGMIPGFSILLGLPLILLSVQLLVAANKPWLPARLARIEIRRSDLRRIVERASPNLQRLERALKPRMLLLTVPSAQRVIGAASLVLSIMVFLPIPFANLMPALGVTLFGFAILERDGLVALAAMAVTVISLALFGGVAFAFAVAAGHAVRQLGLIG